MGLVLCFMAVAAVIVVGVKYLSNDTDSTLDEFLHGGNEDVK